MHICLNLDPSRLQRWHLWLAEALAAGQLVEPAAAYEEPARSTFLAR
jgi:hypothetical protein